MTRAEAASARPEDETPPARGPHVVILGAGFAGLEAAQRLASTDVQVTLVDRENHHLFQPLLYQVATAGLAGSEIAQPIRSILRSAENVEVVMDEAVDISPDAHCVRLRSRGDVHYDRLILATGAETHYFGNEHWARFAPGLKTLEDAHRIRARILRAFEEAEYATDPERRRALMRIVVVGGGPTGVELAGALAELTRRVLQLDFRRIDPSKAEIILLEVAPRVLLPFSERLSGSAVRQLRSLGVDVRLSQEIVDVRDGEVELKDETIRAANVIWGAGVRATSIGKSLGGACDGRGRLEVRTDLSLPEHPDVFVVGDAAKVVDGAGNEVPGVAPAAIQMGRHVAELLREELLGDSGVGRRERPAFAYRDRGSMATLGRSKAVAQVGRLEMTGLPAWLLWLGVHLVWLLGFRNKVFVLLQWLYAYVAYRRGARIIEWRDLETEPAERDGASAGGESEDGES